MPPFNPVNSIVTKFENLLKCTTQKVVPSSDLSSPNFYVFIWLRERKHGDILNEETCLQFLPTVTCLLGLVLSRPCIVLNNHRCLFS